jgi:hypothetical protein
MIHANQREEQLRAFRSELAKKHRCRLPTDPSGGDL